VRESGREKEGVGTCLEGSEPSLEGSRTATTVFSFPKGLEKEFGRVDSGPFAGGLENSRLDL
jgi:hypothetical protein